MIIRHSEERDFERMLEIYAYARQFMADHGNPLQWADDSSYGVVHRLASDGSVKGTGAFCLDWAFSQCGHMRVDTHGDNTVMQNLLTKLGFERRGTIYVVEDPYPRFAYEK